MNIEKLSQIMAELRHPQTGCPWDIAQDFSTIAPYTIEEAYEVADAIQRDDMAALKDELGDLLLQVVFHSRMAEEAGHFALPDVIAAICDKMVRRHPHIFSDIPVTDWNWEELKAKEREAENLTSAMDGVATALPALMRAQKLQKRAARTGFDWDDVAGCYAKLDEETAELQAATNDRDRVEEAGDMLFAAVNVVRKLGIDAEDALRAANRKFDARFRHMEQVAGDAFAGLPLDDKEALWIGAKQALRSPQSP